MELTPAEIAQAVFLQLRTNVRCKKIYFLILQNTKLSNFNEMVQDIKNAMQIQRSLNSNIFQMVVLKTTLFN